jgi:hypothetical protein
MVLGGIELNLSGREAGWTKVSNTFLCQAHKQIESARDALQSAMAAHARVCEMCQPDKPCNEYRYLVDAFYNVNDLIDDWSENNV